MEATLSRLEARHEIRHRHPERARDPGVPGLSALGLLRRSQDLRELRAQGASEQRQGLARERLVGEEVLHDRRREARQRVLARPA